MKNVYMFLHDKTLDSLNVQITQDDLKKIKQLIKSDFKEIDILLIEQTERAGNGSTHLLQSIANSLLDRGENILYISWRIFDHLYSKKTLKHEDFSSFSHIVIDDAYCLFEKDEIKLQILKHFQNYLENNGKLIFTWRTDYINDLFNNRRVTSISTHYPPWSDLKKVLIKDNPNWFEIIEYWGDRIYENCKSIQVLEGRLLSIKSFMMLYEIDHPEELNVIVNGENTFKIELKDKG